MSDTNTEQQKSKSDSKGVQQRAKRVCGNVTQCMKNGKLVNTTCSSTSFSKLDGDWSCDQCGACVGQVMFSGDENRYFETEDEAKRRSERLAPVFELPDLREILQLKDDDEQGADSDSEDEESEEEKKQREAKNKAFDKKFEDAAAKLVPKNRHRDAEHRRLIIERRAQGLKEAYLRKKEVEDSKKRARKKPHKSSKKLSRLEIWCLKRAEMTGRLMQIAYKTPKYNCKEDDTYLNRDEAQEGAMLAARMTKAILYERVDGKPLTVEALEHRGSPVYWAILLIQRALQKRSGYSFKTQRQSSQWSCNMIHKSLMQAKGDVAYNDFTPEIGLTYTRRDFKVARWTRRELKRQVPRVSDSLGDAKARKLKAGFFNKYLQLAGEAPLIDAILQDKPPEYEERAKRARIPKAPAAPEYSKEERKEAAARNHKRRELVRKRREWAENGGKVPEVEPYTYEQLRHVILLHAEQAARAKFTGKEHARTTLLLEQVERLRDDAAQAQAAEDIRETNRQYDLDEEAREARCVGEPSLEEPARKKQAVDEQEWHPLVAAEAERLSNSKPPVILRVQQKRGLEQAIRAYERQGETVTDAIERYTVGATRKLQRERDRAEQTLAAESNKHTGRRIEDCWSLGEAINNGHNHSTWMKRKADLMEWGMLDAKNTQSMRESLQMTLQIDRSTGIRKDNRSYGRRRRNKLSEAARQAAVRQS